MPTLPPAMRQLLAPFAPLFGRRVWHHALVLVAGAILTPGRRTVCAALRAMGLRQTKQWTRYHRVLNRARWSGLAASRVLLGLLVAAFAPAGPVVVGVDETIARRWGAKIAARGRYRDAVRSSKGYFVKVRGLRWLCLMLLVPIPWAGRAWALPFLTILAPSERHDRAAGRRHKKLTDWARQALLLLRRWLPRRALVIVADSGYAAIALLARCARLANPIAVVTRLRLDAGHCQVKPFRHRRRSESGERSAHKRPDPACISASDGQNWLDVGRFRSVKT